MMAALANDPSRFYDSCTNLVLLLEGTVEPYFSTAYCPESMTKV